MDLWTDVWTIIPTLNPIDNQAFFSETGKSNQKALEQFKGAKVYWQGLIKQEIEGRQFEPSSLSSVLFHSELGGTEVAIRGITYYSFSSVDLTAATTPVEDTRGKWSNTDEVPHDRPSSVCFKGKSKGTAVGRGEGEREMEVEYPADDGTGELLLELIPDGGEATPVSGDLFRLW